MRPHVVQGLRNNGNAMVATPSHPRRKRVFQEASTATVRNWMAAATRLAQAPGTGLHHPVAGKSGTSQKALHGGYDPDTVTTSFVAHLPTDQPRFVVLAVVDEPRGEDAYGATVALPVAYRVIDSIMALDNLLPARTAPVDGSL